MSNDNNPENNFSNLFNDSDSSSVIKDKQKQSASNPTNSHSANTMTETSKEMKTVIINIGGANYPINIMAGEQEELEKAALYINHFMREIRKDAPTLNHENLLALCCLNMYEEMKQQKTTQASIIENEEQMLTLIKKITQDVKSTLK